MLNTKPFKKSQSFHDVSHGGLCNTAQDGIDQTFPLFLIKIDFPILVLIISK